jgi:hypothetical protein
VKTHSENYDKHERRVQKSILGNESRKKRKNWRSKVRNDHENMDMVQFQKFTRQKRGY